MHDPISRGTERKSAPRGHESFSIRNVQRKWSCMFDKGIRRIDTHAQLKLVL